MSLNAGLKLSPVTRAERTDGQWEHLEMLDLHCSNNTYISFLSWAVPFHSFTHSFSQSFINSFIQPSCCSLKTTFGFRYLDNPVTGAVLYLSSHLLWPSNNTPTMNRTHTWLVAGSSGHVVLSWYNRYNNITLIQEHSSTTVHFKQPDTHTHTHQYHLGLWLISQCWSLYSLPEENQATSL